MAHHGGAAAEAQVLAHYRAAGCMLAARRWRGTAGEIDLILRDGDAVVFVEVKRAHSHAAAAARIGARQSARLFAAAAEFLATEPAGSLTETRFDVALVDATGRVEIVADAFL